MSGLPAAVQVALVSALVVGYYGRVVRLVGEPLAARVLGVLLDGSRLVHRWSVAELDGVVRLALAGLLQVGFVVVLVAALPLPAGALVPDRWDLRLLPLGVLLGVAEAGLATYVAYVGSRVAERVRPGRTPTTVEGWLGAARGGWVRYYLRTAAVAPTWVLVGATTLYVAGEELVFRAIVLGSAAGVPPAAAVALSAALFALAQVFYTPGWQTALFPVLAAVTVGVVHGCLYLAVPDVTPLIAAHATMFLITVL